MAARTVWIWSIKVSSRCVLSITMLEGLLGKAPIFSLLTGTVGDGVVVVVPGGGIWKEWERK